MKNRFFLPALLLVQSFFAHGLMAAPFDSCPSDAYLVQGKLPRTFAVNLLSGDYQVAAEHLNVSKRVNAIGFNPIDQYIYGWSYEHQTVARIHGDFSVEPLQVENIPDNNFYVGDMHPANNTYYAYRRGQNYGLYKVDLNPESADYLKMQKITDGKTLSVKIADMAINPADGHAYALSRDGELYRIELETGTGTSLGDAGINGTFGAAYFDPNGNFYVGRNNDGSIFRIAVSSGDYTAQFQSAGPASNINDGARCAVAPVGEVSTASMDFGDAPDSYQTYLDNDGARHIVGNHFLGSSVDVESDGSAFPLSDDDNENSDDEDGIQFATALVEGKKTVLMVKSSGSGYLNGWIDIDANGTFDGTDQLISDIELTSERQPVYIDLPYGLAPGKTWARFRVSSQTGLQAYGEAPDGEVEDYSVELREQEVTVNHYPSATGWTTLAFEDNWPHEGDFDMNDLVIYLRTGVEQKAGGISKVIISGEVAAVGAAYHNGFAIRLPGVLRDQVDTNNVKYTINGQPVAWQPIEGGREEAILMVTYNLWDYVGTGEHCLFYRTEEGCGSSIQMKFEAEIPMLQPVNVPLRGVLDPFIFATPGAWHGGHFVTAPGRGYEIHLKNQAPTEAFDITLFDQPGDDASDANRGLYFQTGNGLPWAIEIGTRWDYPIEYHDISHAYPMFAKYASSGGEQDSYWYNTEQTNSSYIFNN